MDRIGLMKWYQYFLFLFILAAPLQSEEKPSPSGDQTTLNDHKEDPSTSKSTDETKKGQTDDTPKDSALKNATDSYETAFVKTIVVLVGLLVLIILTVWMFKKISRGRLRSFNYTKSIKVIEKRPLSPKSMLYLIEVGGRQVLIAESQFNVKEITTLDWIGSEKDL